MEETKPKFINNLFNQRLDSEELKNAVLDDIHQHRYINIARYGVYHEKKKQKKTSFGRKKSILSQLKCAPVTYEMFFPIHNIWLGYIKELLEGTSDSNEVSRRLCKADLHGANMKVIKSKNPSLVGIEGFIVMETKNVFKVITSDDKLKTIVKAICIFGLQVEEYFATIYGQNFCLRSYERICKTFKRKSSIDL